MIRLGKTLHSVSAFFIILALCCPAIRGEADEDQATISAYDLVVVGGTPGGIMASIAAGRMGSSVVLLERTQHIGGLPANGLGATDIATRGATGGLFMEFVSRIRKHYQETYGIDSPQFADCSDGYRFEPHVAEAVFKEMLEEVGEKVEIKTRRQFDSNPSRVIREDSRIAGVKVMNREERRLEVYRGRVFVDATYEGDLAAAAGADFRLGREGWSEFKEPMAGVLYKPWGGKPGSGSSGLADNAVQAYNYRLCLTDDPDKRIPFPQPEHYNRDEYLPLIEDIREGRFAAVGERREMEIDGIGRITNMVRLPNQKTDANNQHAGFISTDLPEENWPWPTSGWAWRDRFADRLRDYTLGLFWFVQKDPELPLEFRRRCQRWGLAKDEYQDNGNFPRQVYVREGRRVEGEYLFTAHDAIPVRKGSRPPLHLDSITASHYALDSHAVRKREEGQPHLDGFFSYPSRPYTVPYGVIIPRGVEGLLTPVPVSGTHIGFSTLRMEPCWMALGQAAGVAAALSCRLKISPDELDPGILQEELIQEGAVLIYFTDVDSRDPRFKDLQRAAIRGFFTVGEWEARLDDPLEADVAARWVELSGEEAKEFVNSEGGWPKTTRGDFLVRIMNRP